MDKLPPFWSWKRPFWQGFMDGLALVTVWKFIARAYRNFTKDTQ